MFSRPALYVTRILIRNLPFERPHVYAQNDHQKGYGKRKIGNIINSKIQIYLKFLELL